MRAASELRPGDVIRSKLLDDKKMVPRVVMKVRPRTWLTYIETQHKANANQREVWEIRSDVQLVVDSPPPPPKATT